MDRLPEGFLDEMIDSINYARAVAMNAADPTGATQHPLRAEALEIEMALATEEIDARG